MNERKFLWSGTLLMFIDGSNNAICVVVFLQPFSKKHFETKFTKIITQRKLKIISQTYNLLFFLSQFNDFLFFIASIEKMNNSRLR